VRGCGKPIDIGRRRFFVNGAAAAAGVVLSPPPGAIAAPARDLARVSYPARVLANERDLRIDLPLEIHYPDEGSPGVLIKLGRSVPGGVGAGLDIVAFSTLCPHKGFPLSYASEDRSLNCRAHYSRFDCENGGQQIWGHATLNLPRFKLRVEDDGGIVAEGVDELIHGRLSNVLQGWGEPP
jgi:arsenite oxidase small subunit